MPRHILHLSLLALANLATSALPTPKSRLDQAGGFCLSSMHNRQNLRIVEYNRITLHARGGRTSDRHNIDGNGGDVCAGLICGDG